jgi:hypothetical protein
VKKSGRSTASTRTVRGDGAAGGSSSEVLSDLLPSEAAVSLALATCRPCLKGEGEFVETPVEKRKKTERKREREKVRKRGRRQERQRRERESEKRRETSERRERRESRKRSKRSKRRERESRERIEKRERREKGENREERVCKGKEVPVAVG